MPTSNTNVASEWVSGKLCFYPTTLDTGSAIMNIDGTNRNISIPSGSKIDFSGATTTIKLAAGTIAAANIADPTSNVLNAQRFGKWTYDFAISGGDKVANINMTGATLPANAIVVAGFWEVLTNFTCTNQGAASVGLVVNADLIANVNIGSTTTFNTAGRYMIVPVWSNITLALDTGARTNCIPFIQGGIANITAGKGNLFLQYFVTD